MFSVHIALAVVCITSCQKRGKLIVKAASVNKKYAQFSADGDLSDDKNGSSVALGKKSLSEGKGRDWGGVGSLAGLGEEISRL